MNETTVRPDGPEFGTLAARDILRASERAFRTLTGDHGRNDWSQPDAFPWQFACHVAAPLLTGFGLSLPAPTPGDWWESVAIGIVERASRYMGVRLAQVGGNRLTRGEHLLLESVQAEATRLAHAPEEAAALGAAVCRLLHGMFAGVGIPAAAIPACICETALNACGSGELRTHDTNRVAAGDAPSTQGGTADHSKDVLDPADGKQSAASLNSPTGPAAQGVAELAGPSGAAVTAAASDGLRPAESKEAPERRANGTAFKPTGVYEKLGAAAVRLGLKLKEKLLVDAIVAAGRPVPISELQLAVCWSGDPGRGWSNSSAVINRKLKRDKLRLYRDDNCGCVGELGKV